MPSYRIALATATNTYEPDPDQDLMLDAFRAAGIATEMLAWDAPDQPAPDTWDAVVLRSTWNYIDKLQDFIRWLETMDSRTQLWNPAGIVVPNLHKGYLLDLQAKGVPIVPTMLVRRGEEPPPLSEDSWVIKPAVGAGSFKVRFARGREAEAHANALGREEDTLVQPYLRSVENGGERSLVWIDGEFTHKVVKQVRREGEDESVSAGLPLEGREREIGENALAGLEDSILYARVDVMEDASGDLLVSELELTEPSLFLKQSPYALDRLVEGVRRRVSGS